MSRRIVYYVACSLDGFIAGINDDISGFVPGGSGIEKYIHDLSAFDTVIMGRRTYEFGYRYGLKPGSKVYPHMKHYIFSSTLKFDEQHPDVVVCPPDLDFIMKLKQTSGTDIYLCGGGKFAGWLLENRQIDVLKIKLNPFVQGYGIRLFDQVTKTVQARLIDSATYEHGLQIMTYELIY